jgi:hypothetical protein
MVYTTSYAEIKAIYDTCRVSQVPRSLIYRLFMRCLDALRNVNLDDVVSGWMTRSLNALRGFER